MKKLRLLPPALFILFLIVTPTCVIADSIVWDFGPVTGLLRPKEGGSSVLVNASTGQNFSDSVSFPKQTLVTGYNLFTAGSRTINFTNPFCVRFWTNNGG